MRPFYVCDRWGEMFDTIPDPLEAIHTDTVNGEDSLTLTTIGHDLQKGDRIVWRDKFGEWHEHQVNDTTLTHSEEGIVLTSYCESSIAELLTDYVVEVEPRGAGASQALSRALENSTWKVGACDTLGTANFSWYHINAYEAVSDVVETLGGELKVEIAIDRDVVSERSVAVVNHVGGDNGQLFTYDRQLQSVERTVSSDDVYTALYGYGKGLPKTDEEGEATGGYSRKLTFGDVNGGRNWVGDDEALKRWGYPDGHGGMKHAFGQVEFSDCEDPEELLELTKAALDKVKEPAVTYTVALINLGDVGVTNGQDLRKGDLVNIRDRDLDLRLSGRVLQVKRDLLDESNTQLTFGNLTETLTGGLNDRLANLDWLQDHMGSIEGMEDLGTAYLQAVIDRLNEQINMTGGYTYWEQGEGITTYDKPIDNNPTMVIQIKGGSFRIANSKKSDGSWDWRTFGTGDGFVADELITGTIKGGANWWDLGTGDLVFMQGIIRSADNENFLNLTTGEMQLGHGIIHDAKGLNSWNLDNGELSITSGAKVGNQTLQSYVDGRAASEASDAVDALERDRLTQQAIFNTLTNGGSTQGIYLKSGRVYINSSYIGTGTLQAGKIQDKSGNNYWDLETGSFRLSPNALIGTSSSSQTLKSYITSNSKDSFADATATQVFNKLTNNGKIQGITMSGNSLYINATYINSGTLSGSRIKSGVIYCDDQSSFWNLSSGLFQSHSTQTIQGQFHNLYTQINGINFNFLMDSTTIGTIRMSTNVNDASRHCLILMSYSDLVFSAPGSIGVADNYPSSSTTTQWTAAVSSGSTVILTNCGQSGNNVVDERTLELTYGQMSVKKGVITYLSTNNGKWTMQKI